MNNDDRKLTEINMKDFQLIVDYFIKSISFELRRIILEGVEEYLQRGK